MYSLPSFFEWDNSEPCVSYSFWEIPHRNYDLVAYCRSWLIKAPCISFFPLPCTLLSSPTCVFLEFTKWANYLHSTLFLRIAFRGLKTKKLSIVSWPRGLGGPLYVFLQRGHPSIYWCTPLGCLFQPYTPDEPFSSTTSDEHSPSAKAGCGVKVEVYN